MQGKVRLPYKFFLNKKYTGSILTSAVYVADITGPSVLNSIIL